MFELSQSAVIRVAPETAFAVLADPANAHAIDPTVTSAVADMKPLGLGARITMEVKVLGLKTKQVVETVQWEEGHLMAFQWVKPAAPATRTIVHTFEPHRQGCRYVKRLELVPVAGPGALFCWLYIRLKRDTFNRQHQLVKAMLESLHKR